MKIEKITKTTNNTANNTAKISQKVKQNLQNIIWDEDIFLHLWKYIFKQTKEKIEKNEMEYIAEWKEWTVYKIEIELPNKEKKIFLAIKKRFDNNLSEEIELQKSFWEITKKSTTGIKVPETLWEIDTTNGKYFLMEYIDGKTLFNLKTEKIAERFYRKFKDKYVKFFNYIEGINKNMDKKNIQKASIFNFKNDTEAREIMYKIVNFLNENWETIIQKYTWTANIALLNKENYDKTIEKIYYDEELCSPIFNQNEWWIIQKKIKDFLHECHKAGLFHRDLWGNTSNIMFTQKNDTIIPVIIDFGKAKKIEWENMKEEYDKWERPYWDDEESYIPDTYICEIIKWLTYYPPRREPGELYY